MFDIISLKSIKTNPLLAKKLIERLSACESHEQIEAGE